MMEVTIIKSTESASYLARALEVTTVTGNRIVLPGHAPALFLLQPRSLVIITLADGSTKQTHLSGGIIEVMRTLVRIIAEE